MKPVGLRQTVTVPCGSSACRSASIKAHCNTAPRRHGWLVHPWRGLQKHARLDSSAALSSRTRVSSDVEAASVPCISSNSAPGHSSAGGASSGQSWLHSQYDREIWQLALPAALALAADPLLGMVDTALVGRLGSDELGALGINTSLFSLSFVVFNFLATATTPMVASAVSSHNSKAAGETVWQATSLAVVLGLAVTAGLVFKGTWMLEVMGADSSQQHMQELALQYLFYRAFAAPAVLLVTVGQGVFRGIQNMRAPLLVTLATNAVHLGLDLLLMFHMGMGIKGAAISTAASEWMAAGAYGWLVWQRRELLGLWPPPHVPRQLGQLKQRYLPFLQAGSAVVMRTGSLLGTKTLATAVAARLGPSSVASHQVLMQLWVLASMLVDSLAVSGQTLIAVQLGKGQAAAARQVSERLLQLGLGLGVALAAGLGLSSPWWPQLFTSDDGVLGQIHQLVPLAVLPLPVNALVYTLDGVLVGASDFGYLMTAMVGASAVAASMLLMVEPSGAGLEGVWTALAVLMVGRLATLGWRFQSAEGPLPPSNNSSSSSSNTHLAQHQQQQQVDVATFQQQQLLLLQELQQQLELQKVSAAQADGQGVPALFNNSVPSSEKLQAQRRPARQGKQQELAMKASNSSGSSASGRNALNGFAGDDSAGRM